MRATRDLQFYPLRSSACVHLPTIVIQSPPLVLTLAFNESFPADVPYDLSPEFIEELFTKHRIDYVIHGDDPCLLPDGSDAYAHAKKLGRFKMVRRACSHGCNCVVNVTANVLVLWSQGLAICERRLQQQMIAHHLI